MTRQVTITTEYFHQYRQKLGFTNQTDVKKFFGAKDIIPAVDLNYIKLLNERLYDIIDKINDAVVDEVKISDIVAFIKLNEIKDDGVNWITRQQMEGQTVFNIDQNYFVWKITEIPTTYKEINFD